VWVVVGLGNPGREYADTRHNLGFQVVDEVCRRAGIRPVRGPGDYFEATWRAPAGPALLLKPTTYVNRSGRALRQLAGQQELDLDTLLVVLDDVYLPFGRLRLRPRGGAGGHNGMRSLLDALGSEEFPRLRLGVGLPEDDIPLPDWVLSTFSNEERAALPDFVGRAADAVERVLELGVDAAVPIVNAPPAP